MPVLPLVGQVNSHLLSSSLKVLHSQLEITIPILPQDCESYKGGREPNAVPGIQELI